MPWNRLASTVAAEGGPNARGGGRPRKGEISRANVNRGCSKVEIRSHLCGERALAHVGLLRQPSLPHSATLETSVLCLHAQTVPACLCVQNPPPNRIAMMFAAGATLVSGFNAGSMPARNSVAARSAVTMQVSEALVAQPVALAKVRTALPPFSLCPSATPPSAVARSLWHKAP